MESSPRFSRGNAIVNTLEDVAVSTQAYPPFGTTTMLAGGKWSLRWEKGVRPYGANLCAFYEHKKFRCASRFNLSVPNGDSSRLLFSAETGGGMCCLPRTTDMQFLDTAGVIVGSIAWKGYGMHIAAYAPQVNRLVVYRGDSLEMFDFDGKAVWQHRFPGHHSREGYLDKVRIFDDASKVIISVDPTWPPPLKGGMLVVLDGQGKVEAEIPGGRETLISPDRRWVAIGGNSGLRLYDFSAKKVVVEIAFKRFGGDFPARVMPVAVSTDGTMLLANLRSPPRGFSQSLLVDLRTRKFASVAFDYPGRGMPSFSFRSNDVVEIKGWGWRKAFKVVID